MYTNVVRLGAAALGFAIGAVWVTAGFGAAMLCLLTAAVGLTVAVVAQTFRVPSRPQAAEWIASGRSVLRRASAALERRSELSKTHSAEARDVATYGWESSSERIAG